ncbi:formyltetrahydrofolate deformylase [Vibrio fluvialis]|jgi:formyltetrahydrofolate deformylase|uniref:formyltetrahydrofolate deformylase n=1 Tax=Vibrio fluvialis TaxID=676 RepID=UPI000CEB4349|nr:formyltetrahydrofolate deformylase [Vibrio fluvialis]AVH34282.1 formyltetrahydrofolate deformylase [Vibrio fluvialis]EKO3536438.1 formyltetrahydrofolate deformylase [Vibrio fluvialis]ELV8682839.1 formyltetrahydrofolate deformylase [Vibrio fluvialis]EMC0406727.1 formyltetrahydrofolate deformylase [Vibrio fluvialis]MBL4295749.1 formyltetrahydrofolate deformylase [Vibrio fluvialis]
MTTMTQPWIFTASCPSVIGTVDVVTRYLAQSGHYIEEIQSFDDRASGQFFIRIEFLPAQDAEFDPQQFDVGFSARAADFSMQWTLTPPGHTTRMAIMVSKYDHCLNDLLYRYRTGQLKVDVPVIISNHPDLEDLAKWHNIPYYHLPVSAETKPEQEAEIVRLLEQYDIELVVLARYMQVLSPWLCEQLDGRAINIHHSLLPGFKGARPYHQAWEKGVKMVGATAHYVNNDLDEGPIIAQGIQEVGHAHYPEDLIAKGQDIERITLFNALKHHTERRVFLSGARTIILSKQ